MLTAAAVYFKVVRGDNEDNLIWGGGPESRMELRSLKGKCRNTPCRRIKLC